MSREKVSGEGWSRLALGGGAVFSIAGNVTHTVMLDSGISLGLRVPFAVIWPLALFIAVEVLVRVPWRRKLLDVLGRIVLILPVSAVAAVVSYRHLHHLMVLAGEDGFSALIGPLAIDGLMMGGTVALLTIRVLRLLKSEPEAAHSTSSHRAMRVWLAGVLKRRKIEAELPPPAVSTNADGETIGAPAIEAGASVVAIEAKERKPRAGKPEQEKAVRLMLDGKRQDAVDAQLMGDSTMRRYEKAMRTLRDNPMADIDTDKEKVRAELINIIRDEMNRERVR